MGLTGCAAALAADELNSALVFAAVMVSMCALIIAAYIMTSKHRTGMTTEVASILILIVGALCYWDEITLAGALAVTTTVLLSVKGEVQRFVRNLTPEDVRSTLVFAVITVIILPVLPDEGLGEKPLDVLNPRQIWLMVVFISGISFLGYILNKFLGTSRGVVLTGLLGGVVSSTASTMSFAQRSKENPELAKSLGLAIMLTWTVMYARVTVIVAVISNHLLNELWLPLSLNMAVGAAYATWLYYSQREHTSEEFQYNNPFRLRPALEFGALFAVILVVARAAQLNLGDAGVFLSSAIGGSVDVNAITLSMSDLANGRNIGTVLAAQAVMLATISNMVVKGGMVVTSSAPELRKTIQLGIILLITAGVIVIFLI
jgi:uncharacterized membrane protein (DUF4010 family)